MKAPPFHLSIIMTARVGTFARRYKSNAAPNVIECVSMTAGLKSRVASPIIVEWKCQDLFLFAISFCREQFYFPFKLDLNKTCSENEDEGIYEDPRLLQFVCF